MCIRDSYQILDENQLVSYDGTTSIVDSGVENVALVGDTLFYTRGNNLHYHVTNNGEFIATTDWIEGLVAPPGPTGPNPNN